MFLFRAPTAVGRCKASQGLYTCNHSVETLLTDQYVLSLGVLRGIAANRTTNTTQPQAVNKEVERVIILPSLVSRLLVLVLCFFFQAW